MILILILVKILVEGQVAAVAEFSMQRHTLDPQPFSLLLLESNFGHGVLEGRGRAYLATNKHGNIGVSRRRLTIIVEHERVVFERRSNGLLLDGRLYEILEQVLVEAAAVERIRIVQHDRSDHVVFYYAAACRRRYGLVIVDQRSHLAIIEGDETLVFETGERRGLIWLLLFTCR